MLRLLLILALFSFQFVQAKDEWKKQVAAGDNFYRSDQFQEALNSYSQALTSKQEPEIFYKRGLCHLQLKKYSEAADDISKYIEKWSNDYKPYIHRGIAYHQQGDKTKGDADINLAANYLAGEDFWLPLNDAAWQICLFGKGNNSLIEKGIGWAEKSKSLEATYYNLDTYAALLYLQGKNSESLEWANRALELAKHDGLDNASTKTLIEKINTAPITGSIVSEKKVVTDSKPEIVHPEKSEKAEAELSAGQIYANAIKEGDNAYQAKKYKAALEAYEKALAAKPDEPDAKYKVEELKTLLGKKIPKETTVPVPIKPEVKKEESVGASQPIYYTVQPTNTLLQIAVMHSVSVDDLKNWNKLAFNEISVGQKLIVGYGKDASGGYKEPEVQAIPAQPSGSTEKQPVYYTVQPTNTLYRIAVMHGVSVDDLKKWNKLASNEISVGQKLIVGYK